ncbi:MAG: hypothetical protein DMG70_33185 [Acidobacteria bacterium]|nr:MAG: hypothetical protein DMG30_11145 [Acidobacteriota bacterium]PYX77999.1 MAG: hypothetical protein DMG70_33185 [Acidobacteriota bacterium]
MLGLSAVVSLNTLRANPQTKPPTAPASKSATITGTISLDEKSFIAESDQKIWTVTNPNALKRHAGHRVSIRANVDTAKDKVTVRSVRVLMPLPPTNNDDILRAPQLFPRRF